MMMQLSAESLKGLGGPGAALLSYSVKLPPAAGGPPPGSAGGGGGSPPGGAGPPGPGAVSTPGGPGPLSAAGPPAPAPAGPALLAAAHGHPALVAAAAAAHYHPSVAQSMTQAAFEFHRAQLYDYNARLYQGLRAYPHSLTAAAHHPPHPYDPIAAFYQGKYDPRTRFLHEEPKPNHSYIGLIAMAILSSKDKKLVLSDIYQWILDNYTYFRARGPGWRNSIRHNLSLNDCFVKAGRSANGKGHFWAVHPANEDDFKKGDFRRRKAQRKVRKHMGLAVPDDEDSPSPPPQQSADVLEWRARLMAAEARHAADREREERENAAAGNGSAPAGETAAAPGDAKDGEATRDDETSPRASPRTTTGSDAAQSPAGGGGVVVPASASRSPGSTAGPVLGPVPPGAGLPAPAPPRPGAPALHRPHPLVPFPLQAHPHPHHPTPLKCIPGMPTPPPSLGRKRLFDVESLLAPEIARTASAAAAAAAAARSASASHNSGAVTATSGAIAKRLKQNGDYPHQGERTHEEDDEDERINVDSDDDDVNVDDDGQDDVKSDRDSRRAEEKRSRTSRGEEGRAESPGTSALALSIARPRTTSDSDRSPARSSSDGEGTETRGPFASPLPIHPGDAVPGRSLGGHPMVIHPSALRATAAAATSWSPLGGYPLSYPTVGLQPSQHPALSAGMTPAEAAAAAQRWQEAFSRIVARSYDSGQNLKLEV